MASLWWLRHLNHLDYIFCSYVLELFQFKIGMSVSLSVFQFFNTPIFLLYVQLGDGMRGLSICAECIHSPSDVGFKVFLIEPYAPCLTWFFFISQKVNLSLFYLDLALLCLVNRFCCFSTLSLLLFLCLSKMPFPPFISASLEKRKAQMFNITSPGILGYTDLS